MLGMCGCALTWIPHIHNPHAHSWAEIHKASRSKFVFLNSRPLHLFLAIKLWLFKQISLKVDVTYSKKQYNTYFLCVLGSQMHLKVTNILQICLKKFCELQPWTEKLKFVNCNFWYSCLQNIHYFQKLYQRFNTNWLSRITLLPIKLSMGEETYQFLIMQHTQDEIMSLSWTQHSKDTLIGNYIFFYQSGICNSDQLLTEKLNNEEFHLQQKF